MNATEFRIGGRKGNYGAPSPRVRFKRSRIDRLNGLYIHAIDRIPAIHQFTFVIPSRDFHGVIWKNFDFRFDFRSENAKDWEIFPSHLVSYALISRTGDSNWSFRIGIQVFSAFANPYSRPTRRLRKTGGDSTRRRYIRVENLPP